MSSDFLATYSAASSAPSLRRRNSISSLPVSATIAAGVGRLPLARDVRPAVEPALQRLVRQRLDLGPVHPRGVRAADDAADRAQFHWRLRATARWLTLRATSVGGSRGSGAWTVTRSPSHPFRQQRRTTR